MRENRAHQTLHLVAGAISIAVREAWRDPETADQRCRKAKARGKRRETRVARLVIGGDHAGSRCQETPDAINRLANAAAYAAAPMNGDPAPETWEDAGEYIARRGGVRKLADLYARRCTDDGDWKRYWSRQADANDEWCTPAYFFALLGCRFDLDPASPGKAKTPWIPARFFFTDCGLERDWFGFVWLNPPFGRGVIDRWVRKFIAHGNGIILVPDRTRAPWWQELCPASGLILHINRPIYFVNEGGQTVGQLPWGCHLVAIGEQGIQALRRASQGGLGVLTKWVA